MSTNSLPSAWTPEQAEFLCQALDHLQEQIWLAFHDEITELWKRRDGWRHPHDDNEGEQLELIEREDPGYYGDDADIPW